MTRSYKEKKLFLCEGKETFKGAYAFTFDDIVGSLETQAWPETYFKNLLIWL